MPYQYRLRVSDLLDYLDPLVSQLPQLDHVSVYDSATLLAIFMSQRRREKEKSNGMQIAGVVVAIIAT